MATQFVRFQTLLDPRMYEKLRKASFKHHRSTSAIIRQALARFFLQEDLEEVLGKPEAIKK